MENTELGLDFLQKYVVKCVFWVWAPCMGPWDPWPNIWDWAPCMGPWDPWPFKKILAFYRNQYDILYEPV